MIYNYFESRFIENKAQYAICHNDQLFKYDQLLEEIIFYKNFLNNKNIKAGNRVALIGDFSIKSIAILFALIDIKAIIIPLCNSPKINDLLTISLAEYTFEITTQEEVSFKKNSPNITSSLPKHYLKLIKFNVPGLVLFSSGTSGEPKAAVHNFDKLLLKFLKSKKTLRTLNFLLFDHWGGLNTMFHILSNGGLLITAKERSPEEICKLIEKHKIQLLPTTPTFLNLFLLNKNLITKYNLNSLEIITYGAEPMPSYTLKLISKLFKNVKLLQTYGLIELGVIRSKSESNNSLWFKIEDDNYRTKIIDDILYIKTDSAMLGYLNAPSPFDSNGWFITGDKVLVKNEYIKVLGRESDIINIGGEKVYPQEIENIIRQIDNVIDVTVYGESNLIVGQIICAKINIREKENIKSFISKVKIECKKELPSYKIPIKFFIEDSKLYNNRFKKQRKT